MICSFCRDKAAVKDFSHFWRSEALLPQDTLPAAGFAYHVADLLLPELSRVVGEKPDATPSNKTLLLLLEPFCTAAARTKENVLVGRLNQGLFEGIVRELKQPQESHPLKNLDAQAFADQLFSLGE